MLSRMREALSLPPKRMDKSHSMALFDQVRGFGSHGNSRRVSVLEIKEDTTFKLLSTEDGRGTLPNLSDSGTSRFACKIDIGRHIFFSDLKRIEDGIDMGPSPKELCYSALGSCTVMTIRNFYENTKAVRGSSWTDSELSNISVILDEVKGAHAHIPEGINLYIKFEGNLSQLQKERLVRAANNCPIKQMLSLGLLISTVIL